MRAVGLAATRGSQKVGQQVGQQSGQISGGFSDQDGGMAVIDLFRQWSSAQRINHVSGLIVRKIYSDVRESVEPRALQMTRAEARGYVRAKSAPLVRAEVATAVATVQGLGDWAHQQLLLETGDRLVETLVTDLLWTKVLPLPRRHAA